MMATRVLYVIARIAGIAAGLLGLFYWITGINIVLFHMLCGSLFSLSFLVFSIIMLLVRGTRWLGVAGIIYAFVLPAFGMAQTGLVPGDLHWLIRIAHLLVGMGALFLIQVMFTRYRQGRV